MTKPSILTKFDLLEERLISSELAVPNPAPEGQGYVTLGVELTLDGLAEGQAIAEGEIFTFRASSKLIALDDDASGEEDEEHHVLSLKAEMDFVFRALEQITSEEILDAKWLFDTLIRPVVVMHLRGQLDATPLPIIPSITLLKPASDR
ncbi:hypothetical protein [Marinobacterium stanieri]|uniref:hypothetical protein n=1 Tax=Marinobacterium stanieri TaxID=49186 RepID=UPI000255A5E3|nr:hypothetical protein [Marinobacterium stanieri]